ncbi:SMI1/KNR4 family protein [Paenibacillus sp. MABNR03]|uniref:SMI1/KNR4 family protein n=1 Tax=Paenibacillus sp. MABNR03 TaxID=3142626 RepID=UPI003D2889B9
MNDSNVLQQNRAFILQCLDAYFDSPHREILMSHPAKTEEEDYGVPVEMQDGAVDEEGWVRWRMLPSTVTEDQIRELEQSFELHVPIPPLYRAFLSTRYVLNVYLRYDDFVIGLPNLPSDRPLEDLHGLWSAWKPLISKGYVPFATYEDDAGPVCWDIRNPHGDEDYAVVWFDHEFLVNDESPSRKQLEGWAKPLFPSFRDMLIPLASSHHS